jgi:pantoate--beta-alanine ligase
MKVIKHKRPMQETAENLRAAGEKIGFVPTMGFLHEGHLSLIQLARNNCDILIVSIYVNPTQFAPNEDFDSYPRDFFRDEKLCRQENVDILFYPDDSEMYPKDFRTYVFTEELSRTMCGISRPDHFRGVTTIVSKLFHIVKPHIAVFGQKDAQQVLIIRRMAEDLDFDTEILTGPIIREKDGLALSSRNKYLSAPERAQASSLYKSLLLASELIRQGERDPKVIKNEMKKLLDESDMIRTDYIEIVEYNLLKPVTVITEGVLIALAVYIGGVRLIDNILVKKLNPFIFV